jgi:hypothetical protein
LPAREYVAVALKLGFEAVALTTPYETAVRLWGHRPSKDEDVDAVKQRAPRVDRDEMAIGGAINDVVFVLCAWPLRWLSRKQWRAALAVRRGYERRRRIAAHKP